MINNRLTPAPYKEISTECGEHGGVATVTFYFTSNYKPTERASATRAIVHEYDEKGRSLHRSYLILRQGVVIPSEEVCDTDFSSGFEDKIIVPRKKSKNHRGRSNQRPRKQTQGNATKPKTNAQANGSQRKTSNQNNAQRRNNNNAQGNSQKREAMASQTKAPTTTTPKKTNKRPPSTRKPPQTKKQHPQQTANNTNKQRNQQKQRRPHAQQTAQPKASAVESTPS